MNILVTGCNGQLGSEFRKIANYECEHNWLFTDVDTLDICNNSAITMQLHKNIFCITKNPLLYIAESFDNNCVFYT